MGLHNESDVPMLQVPSHHVEKSKSVRILLDFFVTFAYSNSSAGSSMVSCRLSLATTLGLKAIDSTAGPPSRYLPIADECRFGCSSIGSRRLLNHVATGSTTFSTLGLLRSVRTSLNGFLKTSVLSSLISVFGLSFSSVSQALNLSRSGKPPTTRPKMECLLSKCWHDLSDTKNWLLLVFLPLLAMLTTPG